MLFLINSLSPIINFKTILKEFKMYNETCFAFASLKFIQ